MVKQRKEIKRLRREVEREYKKGNKNYVLTPGELTVEGQNIDGTIITGYKSKMSKLTRMEAEKVANVMYKANQEIVRLANPGKDAETKSVGEVADQDINAFVKKLVGLGNLKGIAEYYIETDKYFKNKMKEIKQHADSFTQARKQQLQQEHEEFKKAKALGVHAVIKYKTNKLLAREKAREIEREMKQTLINQQQNQAKMLKQMSYTMNHYKPKNEEDKLMIGTQNYMHTKRMISMLDFSEMRLKQIRDFLKNKRYKTAEDLFDKTDFTELKKEISLDCSLDTMFNTITPTYGYQIQVCTSYINAIQQRKNWYKDQMKNATKQVYSAHV